MITVDINGITGTVDLYSLLVIPDKGHCEIQSAPFLLIHVKSKMDGK